jgi:hypothetical protein
VLTHVSVIPRLVQTGTRSSRAKMQKTAPVSVESREASGSGQVQPRQPISQGYQSQIQIGRLDRPQSVHVPRDQRQCCNCGSKDHLRDRCFMPLVTCYSCGEQGHHFAFCPGKSLAFSQGLQMGTDPWGMGYEVPPQQYPPPVPGWDRGFESRGAGLGAAQPKTDVVGTSTAAGMI